MENREDCVIIDPGPDEIRIFCCEGAKPQYVTDCRDGCCSDYFCPICKKTFRIEFPD